MTALACNVARAATVHTATRDDRRFAAVLGVVFLAVVVVRSLFHEPWRDELGAWMGARDASSLGELFDNIRYGGHPFLWNVCLFVVSRLTRDVLGLQLFHATIAAGVAYLILRFSPFTRRTRILLVLGYFPFFEYAVISRNYSLGLLLTLMVCVVARRKPRPLVVVGALLALLACTSVYGVIIAVALASGITIDELDSRASTEGPSAQPRRRSRDALIGLTLFVIGAVVAVAQMTPPRGSGFATAWYVDLRIDHVGATLGSIARAAVPIPRPGRNFWNSHVWAGRPVLAVLGVVFVLVAGAAVTQTRRRAAIVTWIVGTAGLVVFTHLRFPGYTRHHAHFAVVLFAALWLFNTGRAAPRVVMSEARRTIDRVLTFGAIVLIVVHVAAGMYAAGADLVWRFSGSEQAAALVRTRGWDDLTLIGDVDHAAAPVAAHLDRPMWYPASGRVGTFVVWDDQRRLLPIAEMQAAVTTYLLEHPGPALLVSNRAVDDPRWRLVATVDESIVADEVYWLYLIQPAGE